MVGAAMHLAFLVSRRWPPYAKWVGTMFHQLPVAGDLLPPLTAASGSESWTRRQDALVEALAILYRAQRAAGLPTAEGLPTEPHIARPILGVRAAVVEPLLNAVTDPRLRGVPAGTGSLEQWLRDHARGPMDASRRVRIARSYLSVVARPSA
jgi:hypothetical protein